MLVSVVCIELTQNSNLGLLVSCKKHTGYREIGSRDLTRVHKLKYLACVFQSVRQFPRTIVL